TLSVVQLLALARVLNVAPVHLLIEPEAPGPDVDDQAALPYKVTPSEIVPRYQARAWMRGLASLPGTDLRTFFREVPAWEWGHNWVLVSKDADPDAPIKDLHKWERAGDRKSTRLNSSHVKISYAVFCLKKKTTE